ncbi:Hypothetical_protein [Hexamita inflata]|uniref:Hypothetical_protein n=1 Tax=Hexamita inflata TaxID=28002 RepID=A0AA86UM02_9EUKA|nr:Hypothetical protein HINF_LOCUS44267 [Hexamita inflata]
MHIGQLNIFITQNNNVFDFNNCNILDCTRSLSVEGQNVDLTVVKGQWESVIFDECKFTGVLDTNAFKAVSIDLIVNEHDQSNNFQSLTNVSCTNFSVKQAGNTRENNINIDLQMGNENHQKIHMSAILVNSFTNLNLVSSAWSSITFLNCILSGDPETYKSKFINTKIQVVQTDSAKYIDFSALKDIQAICSFKLNRIQLDQSKLFCIQSCKPVELQLCECSFQFADLVGTWKSIIINKCEIQYKQIEPQSIFADKIEICDLDYRFLDCLKARSLIISHVNIHDYIPNVKKLEIVSCNISASVQNKTVTHLILQYASYSRFSVLSFKSLKQIQFKFPQENNLFIQKAIVQFLKLKKNNKYLTKSMLKRVRNEQNRIRIKLIRISLFKTMLNEINYELAFKRLQE